MAAKRGAVARPSPTKPKTARKAKVSPEVQAAADRAEARARAKQPEKTQGKTRARPPKGGRPAKAAAGKARTKTARRPPAPAPRLAPDPAAASGASRGRGRPTLYSAELCDLVMAAGSEGKSKAQIAALLGISRQCWHDWCEAHADFLDAVKEAEFRALAWWEENGQRGITMGKEFNAAAYCFQMKNRFKADYRDTIVNHNTSSDSVGALMNELDGQSGRFRQAA